MNAISLKLSDAEFRVLRAILHDALERAPEDLAAILDEALPEQPLRFKHVVWTDLIVSVEAAAPLGIAAARKRPPPRGQGNAETTAQGARHRRGAEAGERGRGESRARRGRDTSGDDAAKAGAACTGVHGPWHRRTVGSPSGSTPAT